MEDIVTEVDVKGYNCPIPLLRAKKALSAMRPGERLKVITTDPAAEIDFKVFAEAAGHTIRSLDYANGALTIVIAKGGQRGTQPAR